MKELYRRLGESRFVRFMVSLKLQVVALFLLFILVGWGTFYQVEHGLYQAQQRFFYSWFFLAGGFFPVPGGLLVLWILFLNLLLVILFRFQYKWSRIGILLIHLGLLVLMVGAGITYYFAKESFLDLREGEGSNLSSDYRDWEIAVWRETLVDSQTNKSHSDKKTRRVEALDLRELETGKEVVFANADLRLKTTQFFPNATPDQGPRNDELRSPSGFWQLRSIAADKDPANDIPGARFLFDASGIKGEILLWGADQGPAWIAVPDKKNEVIAVRLRKKKTLLPVTITLLKFNKEEHPGTRIASSYESRILLDEHTGNTPRTREVRIYMNNPLRLARHTFFQASFSMEAGQATSVLAVTENGGWIVPYLSSGLVFIGLFIHFGVMLFRRLSRKGAVS